MREKYTVIDLKTQTEQTTSDFLEAMSLKDLLFNKLKHSVSMVNNETNQEFNWIVE